MRVQETQIRRLLPWDEKKRNNGQRLVVFAAEERLFRCSVAVSSYLPSPSSSHSLSSKTDPKLRRQKGSHNTIPCGTTQMDTITRILSTGSDGVFSQQYSRKTKPNQAAQPDRKRGKHDKLITLSSNRTPSKRPPTRQSSQGGREKKGGGGGGYTFATPLPHYTAMSGNRFHPTFRRRVEAILEDSLGKGTVLRDVLDGVSVLLQPALLAPAHVLLSKSSGIAQDTKEQSG